MSNRETTAAQRNAIAAFCRQHSVRRLTWLYEPVRTGPDADSEVAFLIEFTRNDTPSLSALSKMESEFSRILGLNTDLHLYIRDLYLWNTPREEETEYDRADYMEVLLPREEIAEFCHRHKIKRLARFPHPRRDSIINVADVDFLAEFTRDANLSWGTLGVANELGELLGCVVDIELSAKEFPTDLEEIFRDTATFQTAPAN